nr:aldehyde dehydrogenase family protein [Rhodococcus sp. MSC1_016]
MTIVSPDIQTTAELRSHLVPRTLFIDGRWVDTDSAFDVVDHGTGEIIGSVADCTPAHAVAALDAASAAQAGWAAVSPRARADLLHSAHDVMRPHADAFTTSLPSKAGKPRADPAASFASPHSSCAGSPSKRHTCTESTLRERGEPETCSRSARYRALDALLEDAGARD